MKPDRETITTNSRRPYSVPRLVVFGDLRQLTQTKGGTTGDGSGKPSTRVTAKPA